MEVGRALSYSFEDKRWLTKLLPLLGVGIVSLIPIFGLIAAALGVGYMAQLAKRVREGLPRPLPDWTAWRDMVAIGGQILLAMILYNLPIILISICSSTVLGGIGSTFIGSAVIVVVVCCTTPIAIIYSGLAWSLLAIGMAEWIETDEPRRLIRIGHQWDVLRVNNGVVFQWLFASVLVNLISLILAVILPVISWLVLMMFVYPVQGHLLGQFAHRLSVVNKPQRAKA